MALCWTTEALQLPAGPLTVAASCSLISKLILLFCVFVFFCVGLSRCWLVLGSLCCWVRLVSLFLCGPKPISSLGVVFLSSLASSTLSLDYAAGASSRAAAGHRNRHTTPRSTYLSSFGTRFYPPSLEWSSLTCHDTQGESDACLWAFELFFAFVRTLDNGMGSCFIFAPLMKTIAWLTDFDILAA